MCKGVKYSDYELLDVGFTMNDLISEIDSRIKLLKIDILVEADRCIK